MRFIGYREAIDLWRKDILNCPPNECIMIEFEGKVFIEEDLVLNSDYPIINVVIEAYSYSGVQWHLEQWHEYRKAYRKVWGQDEIMRCSLINDPGIPYRVFKRYINDGYPYYG